MANLFEDVFGGGYDANDQATTSLNQANGEANAQNATGATVQSVDNVDMSANGEVGQAAASNAAKTAGGARSEAQGAAGSAGLSGAAAANAGAQAGANSYGSAYSNSYNNALSNATTERGQTLGANEATASNQTSASETNTNAQTTERGQNLDYATGMSEVAQKGAQSLSNSVGNFASGVASLFSDRNLKTNIKDDDGSMLEAVAKSIRGHKFNYKPESGEDPGKQEYGVMAQDLEKTPLKNTVMDTPNGKMVDTRRLTTENTAMISDLSRKLDKALAYMGGVK